MKSKKNLKKKEKEILQNKNTLENKDDKLKKKEHKLDNINNRLEKKKKINHYILKMILNNQKIKK